jgi:hypothetical protein
MGIGLDLGAGLGGIGSYLSGRDNNSAQKEAFSKNYWLQKEKFFSGYHWAARDLRKAGINPILAGKWGPASANPVPLGQLDNLGNSFATGASGVSQSFANTAQANLTKQKEQTEYWQTAITQIEKRLKENLIPGSNALSQFSELVENTLAISLNRLDLDTKQGVNRNFEKAEEILRQAIEKIAAAGGYVENLWNMLQEAFR